MFSNQQPLKYKFSTIEYNFDLYMLPQSVISCREAANIKRIPLVNELKTLILETSNGPCAVNLTGNKQLSLRKVKNKLQIDNVCLASLDALKNLNMLPGTVCPFLPQVWFLPNLIDTSILDLEFVSTNNGTRNKCITFPPNLLLRNKKAVICNISV